MIVPYRLIAYAALLAAAVGGFFAYSSHERTVGADAERALWEDKVKLQKAQAVLLLKTATDQATEARLQLAASIEELGKQREKLQAENAASLLDYAATHRLRFRAAKGCGVSGDTAQSGAPSTADNTDSTYVQLPDKVNSDLFRLAGDAQSLAIDYSILYKYVNNPRLVCELKEVSK